MIFYLCNGAKDDELQMNNHYVTTFRLRIWNFIIRITIELQCMTTELQLCGHCVTTELQLYDY